MDQTNIVGWLKWDKALSFDKVVMRYDPNVQMISSLNSDVRVFKENKQQGVFQFPKEYLLIEGFFGYHAIYSKVPENELNLNFTIELLKGDEIVLKAVQTTHIRIPRVRLTEIPADLFVTDSPTAYEELTLAIVVEGADARDLQVSYDPETGEALSISVKVENLPPRERRDPFLKETAKTFLKVRGKGMGRIKVKARYHDYVGNEYSSTLGTLTIQVDTHVQQDIPVYYPAPQKEVPMLVAAR